MTTLFCGDAARVVPSKLENVVLLLLRGGDVVGDGMEGAKIFPRDGFADDGLRLKNRGLVGCCCCSMLECTLLGGDCCWLGAAKNMKIFSAFLPSLCCCGNGCVNCQQTFGIFFVGTWNWTRCKAGHHWHLVRIVDVLLTKIVGKQEKMWSTLQSIFTFGAPSTPDKQPISASTNLASTMVGSNNNAQPPNADSKLTVRTKSHKLNRTSSSIIDRPKTPKSIIPSLFPQQKAQIVEPEYCTQQQNLIFFLDVKFLCVGAPGKNCQMIIFFHRCW